MDGIGYRPVEWHLREHRQNAWVVLPAAGLLVVTVSAWIGTIVFDDGLEKVGSDADADWTIPLVAIGGMSLIVLVIGAAFAWFDRLSERRRARRAVATALVEWPQQASEGDWRRRIEVAVRTESQAGDNLWWGIGVPTVLIGGIVGWAIAADVHVIVFPLVGMWLLIMALMVVRRWTLRRRVARDRARRDRIAPVSRCWVSTGEIYDEDTGLFRLDQIVGAELISAAHVDEHRKASRQAARRTGVVSDLSAYDSRLAKAGWGMLALTIDPHKIRTWSHRFLWLIAPSENNRDRVLVARHVRVPPGQESAAVEALVAIQRRWSL